MKILELFSGTGSFSKVAKARGHEVFTVELDYRFSPDMIKDIMNLEAKEILDKFGKPDIIWASPPCTAFSILQVSRNWIKEGDLYIPRSEKAKLGLELVNKTLNLINDLQPKYWF